MARKFVVDASKKIFAARHPDWIRAAKNSETVDPRIEQLETLMDRVDDDFEYVMAGIDRLGREGMYDEALNLLNTLAGTLNSAISIIGSDFEDNKPIESYEEPLGDQDII